MAGTTGLEPATSAVTGQRSNQLSYVPTFFSSTCAKSKNLLSFAAVYLSPASLLHGIEPISAINEQHRQHEILPSMLLHCRRAATQNICPCPVIQIVPNKSVSEEMDKALRQGSIRERRPNDRAGQIGLG